MSSETKATRPAPCDAIRITRGKILGKDTGRVLCRAHLMYRPDRDDFSATCCNDDATRFAVLMILDAESIDGAMRRFHRFLEELCLDGEMYLIESTP
jgi:choline dehydrogenase-like flavoprotein